MKTVTEFSGFTIKSAAQARAKLTGEGVAPEQLSERLGVELSVGGDRLARLVEALDAVGADAERVRLVRVFAATDEPRGAKKIGEFNYLIDFQPQAGGARPGRDERGPKRGGRGGGGDRPRGGGGGGGGGGGERGGGMGGFKPRQPMGLKSLTKAAKQGGGGPPKDEREERGPTPSLGQGWMLTRAPGDPFDKRGKGKGKGKGPRRGPPGKPGERSGKPGERSGKPGERPSGGRPSGKPPWKPGERPPRPTGDRPRPPGGPRPPSGPRPPGDGPRVEGQANQPGGPSEAEQHRRRRRRGRGHGPRPPGAPSHIAQGAPPPPPGPLAGSFPPPPAPSESAPSQSGEPPKPE